VYIIILLRFENKVNQTNNENEVNFSQIMNIIHKKQLNVTFPQKNMSKNQRIFRQDYIKLLQ